MVEDNTGKGIIEKLEELDIVVDKLCNKVAKKAEGKKNSHLHLLIETGVIEDMRKEAQRQDISLAEWCRKKLKEDAQLDRIERKIDGLTPR